MTPDPRVSWGTVVFVAPGREWLSTSTASPRWKASGSKLGLSFS